MMRIPIMIFLDRLLKRERFEVQRMNSDNDLAIDLFPS